MVLRKTPRKKDGKTHDYWSIVESKRVAGGRVVQRHVLYLGEINSSQAAVWRKTIGVLDDNAGRPRTLALFRDDRSAGIAPDAPVMQLRLSDLRLRRPRQCGAYWLAGQLWQALQLDRFWADRLPPSRKSLPLRRREASSGPAGSEIRARADSNRGHRATRRYGLAAIQPGDAQSAGQPSLRPTARGSPRHFCWPSRRTAVEPVPRSQPPGRR
jgi:hypothetical protein